MSERKVWATSEDGKIEYTSLTSDRLGETIQLLRKSFFPYENVCKAIGLANIPEAIVECDDMVINTAKHGVSVVAIDKETGKMAGAVINKIQDKNTSSKKFYEEYIKNAQYPETRGIFEFLVHMEDSIDPFSPYDADCLMELVFLGVLPEYSKRGIGYMLCAVSIQLASLLYEESGQDFYIKYLKLCKSSVSRNLIQWMLDMDNMLDIYEHCKVRSAMEIMFVGIAPEFRKRGIAKKLFEISIDVARHMNEGKDVRSAIDDEALEITRPPELVTAVCTSFVTQKIAKGLNFELAGSIDFDKFAYDGISLGSRIPKPTRNLTYEFLRL